MHHRMAGGVFREAFCKVFYLRGSQPISHSHRRPQKRANELLAQRRGDAEGRAESICSSASLRLCASNSHGAHKIWARPFLTSVRGSAHFPEFPTISHVLHGGTNGRQFIYKPLIFVHLIHFPSPATPEGMGIGGLDGMDRRRLPGRSTARHVASCDVARDRWPQDATWVSRASRRIRSAG
jgi:hypothetical protein